MCSSSTDRARLASTGDKMPTLRHPGVVVAQRPVLAEDPGLQERLDQGQDAFVGDPPAEPVHQGRMGDFVETCRDVALDDPLIGAGRQIPGLGDRVMSPPPGAEAVAARQEIRLQDRLQHQGQRRLDHPVGDGRDPQAALFAACLRDHPLPHRHRAETAVLQTRPQPVEELLHPHDGLHVVGALPIHARRLGAPVVPHPIPRHQQERGIGDKVEHIIKPAMRIIPGPTVQLRLDPQYPSARRIGGSLQLAGVHQRPSWHSSISATDLLAPFAMYVPLARPDYYEASAPPSGPQPATGLPTTRPAAWRPGRPRMVPTFTRTSIGQTGAQLYPGSIAAPTP